MKSPAEIVSSVELAVITESVYDVMASDETAVVNPLQDSPNFTIRTLSRDTLPPITLHETVTPSPCTFDNTWAVEGKAQAITVMLYGCAMLNIFVVIELK